MDVMAIVSSVLAQQAGGARSQIAATFIKSNADAEKFAVQTLLGGQASPSTANLGPGVGGNINLTA
jgi:hypothetical protein